jgi:hypothetical protein
LTGAMWQRRARRRRGNWKREDGEGVGRAGEADQDNGSSMLLGVCTGRHGTKALQHGRHYGRNGKVCWASRRFIAPAPGRCSSNVAAGGWSSKGFPWRRPPSRPSPAIQSKFVQMRIGVRPANLSNR